MDKERDIKCVVWDLDRTVWDGILLEGDDIRLKPGVLEIIKALDGRGILHSIASKNDFGYAMEKLKQFQLHDYFLYPEINWNAKSFSISRIRKNLNISLDNMAFIDDEPFERDEVQSIHPEVMCLDAANLETLLSHPRLKPKFITEDSERRRLMYMAQIERTREEESYEGPRSEFLSSLDMRLYITRASEDGLLRVQELTARTNQLNTTGVSYSHDDLRQFIHSPHHLVLLCELEDKYGSYGKVGLALVEIVNGCHHVRLFILSCRVLSLGIGTVFLNYIMQLAKHSNHRLRLDYRKTGRNRQMYITLKMANFKESGDMEGETKIFENDLTVVPQLPSFMDIHLPQFQDNR
jgi:FkbH-like protein